MAKPNYNWKTYMAHWERELAKPKITLEPEDFVRDETYIAKVQSLNDCTWKCTERYLYYNSKNESYVLPTIISCFLCFFLKGGIIIDAFIIAYVITLCWRNNLKLDTNPDIVLKRKATRLRRRERGEDV